MPITVDATLPAYRRTYRRKFMTNFKTVLAAVAVTSALALSTAAAAMTKYEKLELEGLSPTLRKQVEAQMTGQQTVRGILETMLLNNISDKVVNNQVVAIDFDSALIVVTNPQGATRAYRFDPTTLAVNPASMRKLNVSVVTVTKK
jgi:hypothetical protein